MIEEKICPRPRLGDELTRHKALRTLRLLETHHKKLAEILRFQHEHPSNTPAEPASATATSTLATQQTTAETGGTKSAVSQDAHLPPRLVGNARLPSRDKSSIASNLASARGIPRTPDVGRPCRLHLHRNMSQQR